jgi:hypothetical protein
MVARGREKGGKGARGRETRGERHVANDFSAYHHEEP